MNVNPIKALAEKFAQVLKSAPRVLGNDSLNFFLDSFKKQGWQGAAFEPWAKRKSDSKTASGRAILVKTARLKRSPRLTSVTSTSSTVSTDVPYAKAHNEGFSGSVHQNVKGFNRKTKLGKIAAVKAHERTIKMSLPKRQFIGESPVLTKQLINKLTDELLKAAKL